jgi:hypothetical protein
VYRPLKEIFVGSSFFPYLNILVLAFNLLITKTSLFPNSISFSWNNSTDPVSPSRLRRRYPSPFPRTRNPTMLRYQYLARAPLHSLGRTCIWIGIPASEEGLPLKPGNIPLNSSRTSNFVESPIRKWLNFFKNCWF